MMKTELVHRLRDFHIIKKDNVPHLLYDIERTFVFEIPDKLKIYFISQNKDHPISYHDHPKLHEWLIQNDLLTSQVKTNKVPEEKPLSNLTDLSLDIAGSCNLDCVYCFEKDINSRLGPMNEKTAFDSVDFLFKKSAHEKNIALHFGSGEPLSNFKLLQKIVYYAEKKAKKLGKDIVFHLTTNGTLITDEVAEFVSKHNFYIRMSIDAIYHNQTRPSMTGNDTYESVEQGFLLLHKSLKKRLTVNVVFCRGMRLKNIYDWALNLGISNLEVIKVGTSRNDDVDLVDEHLLLYKLDLNEIIDDLYRRAENNNEKILSYLPITKTLRRLVGPVPAERFCGVASTYLGVSSKGEVYPCFRHLGLEKYKMGDVEQGIDDKKRSEFLTIEAQSVETRPICSSCWARNLCGGGCYADSVVYGPNKEMPQLQHCQFWKAEIESGIRLFNKVVNNDPALLFKLIGRNVPLND